MDSADAIKSPRVDDVRMYKGINPKNSKVCSHDSRRNVSSPSPKIYHRADQTCETWSFGIGSNRNATSDSHPWNLCWHEDTSGDLRTVHDDPQRKKKRNRQKGQEWVHSNRDSRERLSDSTAAYPKVRASFALYFCWISAKTLTLLPARCEGRSTRFMCSNR